MGQESEEGKVEQLDKNGLKALKTLKNGNDRHNSLSGCTKPHAALMSDAIFDI